MGLATMLFTQVHCLRDGQVLLMHRTKEPNLGQWVAPGGKVEVDESPYDCAVRELREETGLHARDMHLRGIISLVLPGLAQPCLQFLFACTDFSGELAGEGREGVLRWWPLSEVGWLPMPQANVAFFPHAVALGRPFYQAKYVYDGNGRLVEIVEYSSQVSQPS